MSIDIHNTDCSDLCVKSEVIITQAPSTWPGISVVGKAACRWTLGMPPLPDSPHLPNTEILGKCSHAWSFTLGLWGRSQVLLLWQALPWIKSPIIPSVSLSWFFFCSYFRNIFSLKNIFKKIIKMKEVIIASSFLMMLNFKHGKFGKYLTLHNILTFLWLDCTEWDYSGLMSYLHANLNSSCLWIDMSVDKKLHSSRLESFLWSSIIDLDYTPCLDIHHSDMAQLSCWWVNQHHANCTPYTI